MKAALAILLEPGDPFVGGLTGYAKPFSQFGDGKVVLGEVLEDSLSLFVHGNTFPRHGHYLLVRKSVIHILRICT